MDELEWIKESNTWGFKPVWEMTTDEIKDECFHLDCVIYTMNLLGLKEHSGMDIDSLGERLRHLRNIPNS